MLRWKQLNIVQKGIVEQIITYGSVFLLSLLVLCVTAYNKSNDFNISQQTSQVEQMASNRKYHHENKVQQEALQGNSSNPIMKTILQNRVVNEQPLKCINQFFTTLYTYNSQAVYKARSHKEQNIATPNITKNKYWFSNRYNGKHSVISNMSSTSMSYRGNNDNILVECHTTEWYPPNAGNPSEYDKHSYGQWYALTYNIQNKKITKLQKLYTNGDFGNDFNTTSTTQSGSGVYY